MGERCRPRAKAPHWLSGTLVNLLVTVISLGIGLAGLEIASRVHFLGFKGLSFSRTTNFWHIVWMNHAIQPSASLDRPYDLRPGLDTVLKLAHLRTNSAGMADQERDLAKPQGAFRVAVIGDSYTMASGVEPEENYASRLEQELNRDLPGRRVEFLNFGVAGYNVRNYASVIRERALRFKPDLILIGWCGINDHSQRENVVKFSALAASAEQEKFYSFTPYSLVWASMTACQHGYQLLPTLFSSLPPMASMTLGREWCHAAKPLRPVTYTAGDLAYLETQFSTIEHLAGTTPVVVAQLFLDTPVDPRLGELAARHRFIYLGVAPAFAGSTQ